MYQSHGEKLRFVYMEPRQEIEREQDLFQRDMEGRQVIFTEDPADCRLEKEGLCIFFTNDAYKKKFREEVCCLFCEDVERFSGTGCDGILLDLQDVPYESLNRFYLRKQDLPWDIMTTERTAIREITEEDLPELFELYEGEGITDYMEPLFPYEDELEYTKSYRKYMYGYYGYGIWLVTDPEGEHVIGRAGFHITLIKEEPYFEMGYVIGTPYQGQGYATEVCSALLEYAKEELEQEEVHCFIEEGNTKSIGLVKKLGFTHCGRVFLNGSYMENFRLCF